MTSLKEAAIELAEGGYWIFPCKPGTKEPAIRGYMKAQWTVDQVKRWWNDHPDCNIALVPSLNGLVVLDIDEYKDECNWDREMPDAMEVRSARGGRHFYFEDEGNRFPGKFNGYIGVDIKHRGLVVLPPSRFEDGVYEWANDLGPGVLPDWMSTKVAVEVDPEAAALMNVARGDDNGRLIEIVKAAPNEIEDREKWLAVGNGLHWEYHGTGLEDQARQAFIEWSMRWVGSDDREMLRAEAEKMWNHAKPPSEIVKEGTRPSTGGTVRHLLAPKPAPLPPTELGEWVEIDGDDLLKAELPDIDWIVEDMIPAGDLISFAGPSGVGKTRYIALLIACLLTGRTDLMGLPSANRPVSTLYFANEEKGEDLQRRIKATMHANGLVGGCRSWVRGKDHGRVRFLKQIETGQYVMDFDLLDKIVEKVKAENIELVIFDPFNTLGGEEENSASGVDQIITCFQYIAQHTGAAVMFIHHTPKDRSEAPDAMRGDSNAWRGSGAIFSALDEGFTLFPLFPPECHGPKDGKDKRRRLMQMQRDGRAARYIVADHAKQREGETLPATAYKFVSHPVRNGGKPIGALQWVPLEDAEGALSEAISGERTLADAEQRVAWASGLVAMLGEGDHFTTLSAVDEYFRQNAVEFWDLDGKDKILRSRGRGAKLIEVMSSQTFAVGHFVSVNWDEKRSPTKRLQVRIKR